MTARRHPSAVALRWLALAAAVGAASTMLLAGLSVPGPWQMLALLLTLVAVVASIGVSLHMRRSVHELEAADERLRQDELAMDALQRELQARTKLELELRQAKNAAESAVMAKGEFLATMSHEIRTPLNGITPMLDLLMHARLAPHHTELVRTAYMSAQQMQRIVDDILDYSKLESDKLELEVTGFNLRELLEGVMRVMERAAQTKGLRLDLRLEPSVRLPVRGDPVRLRQVLGNLISNAVKFTERGSVSVQVRRIGETAALHHLRFEVRDTGIGISAEGRSRLFQAFSQADASTTRLYGGTGLGLAISRRIVELMEGRIDVDSEPGAGSTFWFEIPLHKVPGDMPGQDATLHDGRALLLVTDPRLRQRLSALLPNWGLRVNVVETTQEALDRLRTAADQGPLWAYSVVVADLAGMRNTAIALYRNVTRHGNLRLVCLSGDEPVPDELQRGATLLSRHSPDADLREAILGTEPRPEPATDVHPLAPAPGATRAASPIADAARGGDPRKPRVLLVEDNPVNQMVGQRLLAVLGIACDTASNGEAALLRIAASRYDLVLMDCQMPVMDGYTATRRWREHEAAGHGAPRLPIIAMTANAMAGDRQKCLDAGMDDYLAKPVTRGELERCIDRWWDPHTASASLDALATPPPPPAPPSADEADPMPAATPLPPPAAARDPLPPAIDPDVLEELRTALGGGLDRLIDLFLDDTPRLLSALEHAVDGPDYDGLRDAAHSLKSSSANLGAMSLSAAARQIESGARARHIERPAVAVALATSEFARAKRALREGRDPGAA